MSTVSRLVPPRLQPFSCPEYLDWLKHQNVLSQIALSRSWRGCLGLVLLVTYPAQGFTQGNRFLVPDRDLRWVSLVDIPPRHFRPASRRAIPWASVHRTQRRFGMPTLGGQVLQAFDFSSYPFDLACPNRPSAAHDTSAESSSPSQLLQVLNALHEAMTNSAFACLPECRTHFAR